MTTNPSARDIARNVALGIARDIAFDLIHVLADVGDLIRELAHVGELDVDRAGPYQLARDRALGITRDLDLELARAISLVRVLEIDRFSARDRARELAHILNRALDRARTLDLHVYHRSFVPDLGETQARMAAFAAAVDVVQSAHLGSAGEEVSPSAFVPRVSEMSCRVTVLAARLLPPDDRETYVEIFRSDLYELAQSAGRWWPQLRCALRVLVRAPWLRRELRASAAARERSW